VLCESLILQDFNAMRKAELIHPLMDEIKTLFAPGGEKRSSVRLIAFESWRDVPLDRYVVSRFVKRGGVYAMPV